MKTTTLYTTAIALAALLLFAPFARAQNPAPVDTPSDRIEQFRQKMNEYLKTALKVSDEEWSVIQPLLETVQTKQRETLTTRFSFMGGRRNGGDRPNRPDSKPVSPETDSLKTALETEGSTPVEIKSRLEAVRAARKKALAELDQAREELRKVLTQRQEATLVMVGVLE